jgi:hypothetical protein
MPTQRSHKAKTQAAPKPKPGFTDPAQVHNEEILRDRERRIADQIAESPVLDAIGIRLEHKAPTNAVEFIANEFDKKNFGTPVFTTRVLFGPDPILQTCPIIKQRMEEIGQEDYAEAVYETIMLKEEKAFDDPLLRRGVRQGIRDWGKTKIAEAFKQRIMAIPSRLVEVEICRDDDDEILGNPLEDAVRRYGNLETGMTPKFMSERCMSVFGRRGYQIVMDEHGDPVKVGTLIMGEIPTRIAERRREHYASISDQAVKDQEDVWVGRAAEFLKFAGRSAVGSRPLGNDEMLKGDVFDREPAAGSPLETGAAMGLKMSREFGAD